MAMQMNPIDAFGRAFYALPVVVVVAALAFFLTRTASQPLPSNSVIFGCYIANGSPPILLDANGMHIRQDGFPVVPFHLERSKTGMLLTAEVPIRADKIDGQYQFGRNERGLGWYLPFYRIQDGRTYGVFEDSQLQGFQMLASDGTNLNYDPASLAHCNSG
jgi:hypothetical protein